MKKRHRKVVNPLGIEAEKNRPEQTPVKHIEHARNQTEIRCGCNRAEDPADMGRKFLNH